MSLAQIFNSFIAFNINSVNNIIYLIKTNLWIILTIIGALAIIVMNIREEVSDYVEEEQNII